MGRWEKGGGGDRLTAGVGGRKAYAYRVIVMYVRWQRGERKSGKRHVE